MSTDATLYDQPLANQSNVPVLAQVQKATKHALSIGAIDQQTISQWQAELTLDFKSTARGSVLKNSHHKGPLYVQKAFYPEGKHLAHVYILHPPGGLVSGDNLSIQANAGTDSKVLLTTPGAGRVYKARSDRSLQQQKVRLNVNTGASIEWLPLETILYPNANARLDTIITLEQGAHFIGWDICCLGLPTNSQGFENGSLQQCLQIEVAGKLCLRERIQLNDTNRDVFTQSIGFANRSVNAMMVAGPFSDDEALETLIEKLRLYSKNTAMSAIQGVSSSLYISQTSDTAKFTDDPLNPPAPEAIKPLCSVSVNGAFLLVRYLGDDSEQARMLFTQCWQEIRPHLLGIAACPPRIWAT